MSPPDVVPASETTRELRALARIALPVIGVQLGLRAMSTVDIMMVGQLSERAMAAVSIGNAWVWMVTIFSIGLLLGTEPMFAQAVGARDDGAVSRTMQRGLCLAALVTLPTMFAIGFVEHAMIWTGQPDSLVPAATSYARIVSIGTLPMLVFGVLRLALQSKSRLRALLVAIVVANVCNFIANYALVFGNFGFEAMGVDGSAWATVVSRYVMVALLLGMGWPDVGRHVTSFRDPELRGRAMRVAGMWRVVVVGAPVGLQMMLELGVFAATTLTIGSLGETAVAGHQIALDLASITFMVSMGLGAAAAVRVGHAVGRGDGYHGVRRAGVTVLVVSIVAAAVFAAAFLVVPELLARAYTSAGPVIALAVVLLPIAGLFQVFDGLQAVAVGVLRGLGDTVAPLVVNLVGFWLVGFPLGLWLCFGRRLGAAGMWWGLAAGLGVVAVGLLVLVCRRFQQVHERIAID